MDRRFLRDFLIAVIAVGAGVWFFGIRPQPTHTEQQPRARKEAAPLFLRRSVDRDFGTLTLADLPSVTSGYVNGVVWRDHVFALTDTSSILQRRVVLEYDRNGKLVGQFNPDRAAVCEQTRDLAIIGDTLYLACVEQGIVAIDLTREAIVRTYGAADGLWNLINLELTGDGTTLWVGTFDGVGKIDTATGAVRFYREELGIPGGQLPAKYGSHVHARNGEVWVAVNANAHSVGGVARYDATTDRWIPYGPEAFGIIPAPRGEFRIDFSPFILSDAGAFAVFLRDGRYTLNRFDAVRSSWVEVVQERSGGHRRQEIDGKLPPAETYRSFESQRAANGTGATFRIVRNGAWVPGQAVGREYLAMAEPIDGTRYLLSSAGIEAMTAADFEPRPIARTDWISGGSTGFNALAASNDGPYLVALSRTMNDFSGGVWAYHVGVFDRSVGTFVSSYTESNDRVSLPNPPRKGEEDAVTTEPTPDGLMIFLNGEPLFRFERTANRIQLIGGVE